jgi:cytochrome bd-type quinol oxidase subunit 1/mono/diheme cytochrome c family protein
MNYPIWELTTIGGGSLIALISILHVYISHLAVGGGLFIWLTDWKGYRENNPDIHDYVRKHTWFFLLLTMVFGGVTGVGIWFIIALVNPAATSSLIHNFVFGWAIEWVFFVGEITALLVYHYKFNVLDRKSRLNLAFLYFLFAWLSLFIINGILSFMLTPGQWLETKNFWHGFFNPTFFPSLVFRTCITIMVAGLFGYLTTVFLKDIAWRTKMMRYCSKWLLYPIPALILSGIWYYYSIPESVRLTNFDLNPQTSIVMNLFIILTIVIFVVGIFLSLRAQPLVQRIVTFVVLIIGLFWMGGFEYSREIARKPYVLSNYMYSTSLLKSDEAHVKKAGILGTAKWTSVNKITAENRIAAGHELFNLQCLSCHTVDGIRNDVAEQSERYTYLGILSMLTGQGRVQTYMPEFAGTKEEKTVLAGYITQELLNKEIEEKLAPFQVKALADKFVEFDSDTDEYVLFVWNDLGMHCISDSDPWFVILPPANTLEAQLIKRGEIPEIIQDGIILRYKAEPGFENPSEHVEFWTYAESNFGNKLERDIGLFGKGMDGTFDYDDDHNSFIVRAIPVVPYKDDDSYIPYPVFNVTAVDEESGEKLIETKVVTPVSTEMGCRNCHEGKWRFQNTAGIDPETSSNLLIAHDRLNDTDLFKKAKDGKPQLCQSCHADVAVGAVGKSGVLNFSAAMHGWHANYMPYNDARACVLCHPASKKGNTRCNRGMHSALGLTCINCHGTMQEHAIALLKSQLDHPAAGRLMRHLATRITTEIDEVNPRSPWVNQPDCLTCHEDFEKPEAGYNAYNTWNEDFSELYRMRTDNVGIRCQACHGSTHALYPANNPFNKNRDNIQPVQYSGMSYPIGSNLSCKVCHTVEMQDAVHHENMERMFRNAALVK